MEKKQIITGMHSHKCIIFGGDGVNALGVVRSLGEKGIKSYVIRLHPTEHIPPIESSKYVIRTWLAKTVANNDEAVLTLDIDS